MSNIHDTAMANAFVSGKVELPERLRALTERRTRLLGTAYRLMYDTPLYVERGEGAWLIDPDGRRYLDAYNNVTSLGHCNQNVTDAICRQASTLATNTRYLQDIILDYSELLLSTFSPELENVIYTCTGSEANDLAYRIAKSYTSGTGVIVTETAYHGITDAVSQFSPSLGPNVPLGAHVFTVAAPDAYRLGKDAGEKFDTDIDKALETMRARGIRPAALIVDSMLTSDGVLAEPVGFLKGAAAKMRATRGIYIADEVQPGFGRTGSHMWGFERHGVSPDIVTMGKPMGNGHPVAGLVARAEVVNEFGAKARYFNTFGGNAVSCAAALAVLQTIQQDDLLSNASAIGALLRERLRGVAQRHGQIGDVRGAGLMIGVEIVRDDGGQTPDKIEAARIVNGMRNDGVLISSCGANHNVLKVRPPLIFTPEHVEIFVAALERTLAKQ